MYGQFNAGKNRKKDEVVTEIQQARVDLAAVHRIAASWGWGESVSNHMTFLVPGSDENYLIIPYGIHWSEVRASDFLVVDAEDKVISGDGEPEISALSLHGPLHRRLPQARCVIHTHQPNITALTALKDQTVLMTHQNATMFHGVVSYVDTYGDLPLNSSAGDTVADVMGDTLVTMLANHGPMIVGTSIARAFQTLYFLDRVIDVQVRAMATGRELEIIAPTIVERMAKEVRDIYLDIEAPMHFAALKRSLDRAGADYAD